MQTSLALIIIVVGGSVLIQMLPFVLYGLRNTRSLS